MANPVYESMAKVMLTESVPDTRRGWKEIPRGCVRVWRSEASMEAAETATNEDVRTLVKESAGLSQREMAHAIVALGRVAAVEVLDETGDGILFYPDWN